MTRLNHERPYFKYVDNLRRELRLDAARTDTLSFGVNSGERSLAAGDASLLLGLLDALDDYLGSIAAALPVPGRKKNERAKTALVTAEAALVDKATAVLASAIRGVKSGDKRLIETYLRLTQKLREVSETAWHALNNFAMAEGMKRLEKERGFED